MADPEKQGYPPSSYPPPQDMGGAYPPPQNMGGAYPPPPQDMGGAYPPPPQPGYAPPPYPQSGYTDPPPPPPPQTIVVQQQQPIPLQRNIVFSTHPAILEDGVTMTSLRYSTGCLVWLIALLVCLFTWGIGLCCLALIPFCINDLKDVEHIDPRTGKIVGIYKRI